MEHNNMKEGENHQWKVEVGNKVYFLLDTQVCNKEYCWPLSQVAGR